MLIMRIIMAFLGLSILITMMVSCDKSLGIRPVSPVVISEAPPEATVDEEYIYTVIATGGPFLTFRLDQAPDGMTIDSATGLISWVPTPDNHFDSKVVVEVANEVGSASQEFVVQVAGLQIEGWQTSSLIAEKIDPAVIRSIASDIRAGTYPKIKSLVIIRNGRLAFENYFNNASRNTSLNIYSAEKSITSCLMGIAIDNGFIADENELLYPFFPEYDFFDNWSAWKEGIRLIHLLTMTCGFALEGENYDIWVNNIGPRDWIKFYLDLPVAFSPGNGFDYESLCDRLAGHVVERQAQMELPEFAAERLFQPLGMAYYYWNGWDPVDNSMISSRLHLRAIDMAKVGQIYLDGGLWHGSRIVSKEWVTRSTTPFRGDYGYNWWIYNWSTPVGNIDVFYAFGNGGNSIFVFETLQLVVVFTGDYFVRPDLWEQQYDLLKYQIIPAVDYLK